MVKLKGPAMSVSAAGSIADVLTFSKFKGVQYLKHKATPAQPRTGSQVSMRAMMKYLSQQWANLTDANKATWENAYNDAELTRYYAFLKYNLTRWRSRKAPTKEYPAAETGTAGEMPLLYAIDGVRHSNIRVSEFSSLLQLWGYLLFHSTTSTPDPDFNKLVHVYYIPDLTDHFWTHSPLPAGTHYYRITGFTTTGKIDLAKTATYSAVVT